MTMWTMFLLSCANVNVYVCPLQSHVQENVTSITIFHVKTTHTQLFPVTTTTPPHFLSFGCDTVSTITACSDFCGWCAFRRTHVNLATFHLGELADQKRVCTLDLPQAYDIVITGYISIHTCSATMQMYNIHTYRHTCTRTYVDIHDTVAQTCYIHTCMSACQYM